MQPDFKKSFLYAFLLVLSLSLGLSLIFPEKLDLALLSAGAVAAYFNILFWGLVGKLVFREGSSTATFWLVLLIKASLIVPAFYFLAQGDKSFIAPVCLSFVGVYMIGAGLLLLNKTY